jgi:hypothetical protein
MAREVSGHAAGLEDGRGKLKRSASAKLATIALERQDKRGRRGYGPSVAAWSVGPSGG